jgi:epidermal growth factor receptor substrate 15
MNKYNIFLESPSGIPRNAFNQVIENLNINSEEPSILEGTNLNSISSQILKNILLNINNMKSTSNKTLIKIIVTKFHELYIKLVNQMKCLKLENSNLKKKSINNDTEKVTKNENFNEPSEVENESLKFLLSEEIECFNQILFDFNVQFNDLQSQEETLRRDILKKHKEIEKLNFDIEESKKQKEQFVKELQTIALKLNDYKASLNEEHKNSSVYKEDESELNEFSNADQEEEEIEAEEFNLLMNADNREYLIKKILQENIKYKSIIKVMKTEEADFNNYLMQMEAELENFSKFKNFLLTKVNTVEDNVNKCRDKIDNFSEKIVNIECKLETADDI